MLLIYLPSSRAPFTDLALAIWLLCTDLLQSHHTSILHVRDVRRLLIQSYVITTGKIIHHDLLLPVEGVRIESPPTLCHLIRYYSHSDNFTDTDTYIMRLESASMITTHLLQEWVARCKLPFPFSFPWLITDPARFPLSALWGFNCFVHAVIVTYSDFAITIHTFLFLSSWRGPCVQPIPDYSLEHETITTHSMYWLLWFPVVYLIHCTTHAPCRPVTLEWAFHHTACGHCWPFRSHYHCITVHSGYTRPHPPCSDYWSSLASPVWGIDDDMLHAGNAGNSLIVHHGNISVCLLNSTHYHWYHSIVSQLNECAFSQLNQYSFRRIYSHVIYMTRPLPHGLNLTKLPLRLSHWHGPLESHHISISALHKSTSYSTYAPLRSLHAYRDRPRGNGGADSTEVYHCLFTLTVHLSDTTTSLEHNDNTTGMAHGTMI